MEHRAEVLGTPYFAEDTIFIWQSGDSIFHYVNGNFELSFDLNVDVGDTRVVHFSADLCFNQDTTLIEDIDTMEYQGLELRRFHYRLLVEDQMSQIEGSGQSGFKQSQYVERIGFITDSPTLNGFKCEGNLISEYEPKTFRCYTDNELAINYPDTCNQFLNVKKPNLAQPKVFMGYESMVVQNAQNSTACIYNILGEQLLNSGITTDQENINIEGFPNGIFIVTIECEGQRFTKKVVKTAY